ncbi:MAG: flagellar motor protein MotB [Methylophilaceae bacterium]
MIRRRIEEDDENPDRWLVSYADFITLLFAFFVVMYSVSAVNQNKYKALSSSISTAFANKTTHESSVETTKGEASTPSDTTPEDPIDAPLPASKKMRVLQQERDAMTALGKNLSNKLSPLIKDGKARVMQNSQGLQIDIKDSALFISGSADVIESAKTMLSEIITPLLLSKHAILVEGHTDNTPIYIQNAAFFSNWELSAVRASSVAGALNDLGVDSIRLSALGFGPSQPISDNATEEGRAINRHISILILYDSLNVSASHSKEIKPH